MNESIINTIGALILVVTGPIFIWRPDSALRKISNFYKTFSKATKTSSIKELNLEITPKTILLFRVLVSLIWLFSIIGLVINLKQ